MDKNSSREAVKGFQEQKSLGVSPWMLCLKDELGENRPDSRWSHLSDKFSFSLIQGKHSLWVVAHFPTGGEMALRVAYCPDGDLEVSTTTPMENGLEIELFSTIGEFCVRLEFPESKQTLLHANTTLTSSAPLLMPFWPQDVFPLGEKESITDSEGIIYTSQVGPRSGLVYFSLKRPLGGTALYFQNLTSLNDYCKQTEASLAGTVGGTWPELGFSLPTTTTKPLKAGQEVTISDTYMIFSPDIPKDDLAMSRQFLEFLGELYLVLPPAETDYIHWPDIAKKSLHDLEESEKCWSTVRQRSFLNAYVGDTETPPESMVQLTVLMALLEYQDWSGKEIPFTKEILAGLPRFFDEKAGVFGRWLVSEKDKLDGSEPQKRPESMDSWYLYHSLVNLSRLALRGDETAKKLFLDSMEYSIKVAHEFDYHWPVFYDLYTLEILKAETKEGEGGELDVAGLYAHVMLQAWELTKEDRYLEEAKKAARTLKGLGFKLFYQANETLFGAGAMLRLYKETGDKEFLHLSYLSLANIFNNMWLWECNYGFAEHYRTFFSLFPLKDGPYIAVYEELEGFAAFHDYLAHYQGDKPEWLKILVSEFIRHLLNRAHFYYPPNLPKEVMIEEPKTGELDPTLWIPLEDLYDGRKQAGQMGQEVYGAGMPFGLIPRHYWGIPNEKFMVYVEYPIKDFSAEKAGKATFKVLGSPRLSCRLRLIPTGKKALPELEVHTERYQAEETLKGQETPEGHMEYELFGDREVTIRWVTI